MSDIKTFALDHLFGLDIDISQEDFAERVSKILSDCFAKLTSDWVSHDIVSSLHVLMSDYKTMLESRVVEVEFLTALLTSVICVGVHGYGEQKQLQDMKVFLDLEKTLIQKNADYGNASVKNGGLVGNYTRLTDKLSRLLNFSAKKELNFEAIADTWLDAAGYATIGIIILQLTVEKLQGSESPFGFQADEEDQESEEESPKETEITSGDAQDDWISKNIMSVFYGVLPSKKTTICEIILKNGFSVVGTSSCVDTRKFDEQLGQKLAFEDAYRKAGELEAYLRQQALYESGELK